MDNYLESSSYINWHHPDLLRQAEMLASNEKGKPAIAKACFNFVRDKIKHSGDYQLNPVTCIASDVLKYKTGYCYAKSHLLAALLRANNKPPFCLHSLNAMYLDHYGWYRVDARGNKTEVDAQFSPPVEQLAFPIVSEGEADLPEIWSEPLPVIVKALESRRNYLHVAENLPDIQLISPY